MHQTKTDILYLFCFLISELYQRFKNLIFFLFFG